MFLCVRFICFVRRKFHPLRHRRNTRYGWLARPFPTRTFTLQDAPSFAWHSNATLSQLIGSLATDVVKVGIATGASIAAASAVIGLGITVAVGPIVAVIAVGVLTSMALSEIDSTYGITDKVIAGLDQLSYDIQSQIQNVKINITDKANEVAASVIDYVLDSAKTIIIESAKHQLNNFLSGKPRVF